MFFSACQSLTATSHKAAFSARVIPSRLREVPFPKTRVSTSCLPLHSCSWALRTFAEPLNHANPTSQMSAFRFTLPTVRVRSHDIPAYWPSSELSVMHALPDLKTGFLRPSRDIRPVRPGSLRPSRHRTECLRLDASSSTALLSTSPHDAPLRSAPAC